VYVCWLDSATEACQLGPYKYSFSLIIEHIGFHKDDKHHTFGLMKKGVYRPLSDLTFIFNEGSIR